MRRSREEKSGEVKGRRIRVRISWGSEVGDLDIACWMMLY